MKPNLSWRLALCGTVALITHSTSGQTWKTVDDFQYVPGNSTLARGATVDPAGNLYVAGSGTFPGAGIVGITLKSSDGGLNWSDPPADVFGTSPTPVYFSAITSDAAGDLYAAGWGTLRWLVRRSQDAGLTWTTVDDFAPGGSTSFRDVALDLAGNVYAVGMAANHWLVRKGITSPYDGTMSWSIVDAFNPGNSAVAMGVFCHPTAGIFVVGQGSYYVTNRNVISFELRWLVRRSRDGGATWTTVDTYLGATPARVGADAAGNLYVVGTSSLWLVRKSSNGGDSWATVDTFTLDKKQGYPSGARGFATDSHGNLFVIGYAYAGSGKGNQWVVRENPGGTGGWRTVDTFQLVTGPDTVANAVAADNSGHVFVAGYGNDAGNLISHWIVRKLSTP
jgi:hypothetical protein